MIVIRTISPPFFYFKPLFKIKNQTTIFSAYLQAHFQRVLAPWRCIHNQAIERSSRASTGAGISGFALPSSMPCTFSNS